MAGRFLGRDPIGYLAGPSLHRFLRNLPTSRVDPSGFIRITDYSPGDKNDNRIELDPDWFVNIYYSQFGCYPVNYHRGCIGIVQDVLGKTDLRKDAECFSFFGDVAKTMAVAQGALSSKKCKDCTFPMMFAFNYWTNGKGANACKTCGRVSNPTFPPQPDPTHTGIPFDFCVRMLDDEWLGGNHGHTLGPPNPPPAVLVWPNIETFAGWYDNYDTTVVSVTCTGNEFEHGGLFGLFWHRGICTEDQLRGLRVPPFLYPEPWRSPTE